MTTHKEIEERRRMALRLQYPGYLSELRQLREERKALDRMYGP